MKFHYLYFSMFLVAFSCNSTPQNGKVADPSTPSVPSASVSPDCKRVGTVIDKFEQNNAVFERLENQQTEQEWLKITTKDGGCSIVDSIGRANHDTVRFEDWDNDGFKDRINESKWFYEVALFNAPQNDFSRSIEGTFHGDQWDYDKARGLKFQFLEDKVGGSYELYKIDHLKKLVYAEISLDNHRNESGKYEVTINNRKGVTDSSPDRTVIKTPPALLKIINSEADPKAAIEDYFRKNEAVFLPK
jgi:hypothetical protein